jgi:hypothetical protein
MTVCKIGKRAVERLHDFGITGRPASWRTAFTLTRGKPLAETGTFVSHQPLNMNAASAGEIADAARAAGLPGQDGFSNDMPVE